MRKTALILAGAIAFDLGVVVATGRAADDGVLKWRTQPNAQAKAQSDYFLKIDGKLTLQVCMAHNGMETTKNGVHGCQFQRQQDAQSVMDELSTTR